MVSLPFVFCSLFWGAQSNRSLAVAVSILRHSLSCAWLPLPWQKVKIRGGKREIERKKERKRGRDEGKTVNLCEYRYWAHRFLVACTWWAFKKKEKKKKRRSRRKKKNATAKKKSYKKREEERGKETMPDDKGYLESDLFLKFSSAYGRAGIEWGRTKKHSRLASSLFFIRLVDGFNFRLNIHQTTHCFLRSS